MANWGAYVVGVTMRFSSNGVLEVTRFQSAIKSSDEAVKKHQASLTELSDAFKKLGVAGAAVWTALTTGAVAATLAASKLQQTLVAIQNSTAVSSARMRLYESDIENVGARYGMSSQESADMVRAMVQSSQGRLSLAQVMSLSGPAASLGAVLQRDYGANPSESAIQALMLGRVLGVSGYRQFDLAARFAGMMPRGDISGGISQLGQVAPELRAMNVDPESMMAVIAMLSQSGTTRAGTGMRSLIQQGLGPQFVTGISSAIHMSLLQQMGLVGAGGSSRFFDRKSQTFNLIGFLDQLHTWFAADPSHEHAVRQLNTVFPGRGANIAALMSDPEFVKGLDALRKIATDPQMSLHQQAVRILGEFNVQLSRVKEGLKDLVTDLAKPWLKQFTEALGHFGDIIDGWRKTLAAHPETAKAIGAGVAAIAGLAGILMVIGGIVLLVPVFAAVGTVIGAIAAWSGPIIAVTAVIITLYEAIKHGPGIVKAIVESWNKNKPAIEHAISSMFNSIWQFVRDAVSQVLDLIRSWAPKLVSLAEAFSGNPLLMARGLSALSQGVTVPAPLGPGGLAGQAPGGPGKHDVVIQGDANIFVDKTADALELKTLKAAADAARRPQTQRAQAGTSRTHPFFPKAHTVQLGAH